MVIYRAFDFLTTETTMKVYSTGLEPIAMFLAHKAPPIGETSIYLEMAVTLKSDKYSDKGIGFGA